MGKIRGTCPPFLDSPGLDIVDVTLGEVKTVGNLKLGNSTDFTYRIQQGVSNKLANVRAEKGITQNYSASVLAAQ